MEKRKRLFWYIRVLWDLKVLFFLNVFKPSSIVRAQKHPFWRDWSG